MSGAINGNHVNHVNERKHLPPEDTVYEMTELER